MVTIHAVPGLDPERQSYGSYASFNDPDGNRWVLQEVKTRLPGRGISLDVATLTELLQETEKRHGTYEPTAPKHHWSAWYAAYVVARERGRTPDEAAKEATLHIEGALARTGVRGLHARPTSFPDLRLCGSSREARRARCGRAVRRRTDSMTPLGTKGVDTRDARTQSPSSRYRD